MTDIVERLRDRAKFDTPVDPYKLLLEAADFIESLRSRAEKAEAERYQLALAICGGEDAPGYLDSIPVKTIVDVARSNHSSHMNDIDRLMKAEATCEKLAAALDQAQRALASMIDPSCIAQTTVIYAFATATTAEATARHVLSEYRKEASE